MRLPRDLSGSELSKLLCKHHGYRRVSQEGATSFCKPIPHSITALPFQTTPSFESVL